LTSGENIKSASSGKSQHNKEVLKCNRTERFVKFRMTVAFPSGAKAHFVFRLSGTAKAVPFQGVGLPFRHD
jgi:hypothetical protein